MLRYEKILVFIIVVFFIVYATLIQAPSNFPVEGDFAVAEGTTLSEIADRLESKHIIRSSFLLKNTVMLLGGSQNVFAGDYFFKKKKNVFQVARIITTGSFDVTPVNITIPEGATVNEMAVIFKKRLPSFDEKLFIEKALAKEGFLFPDTYSFFPNTEVSQIIQTLEKTFKKRITEIRPDILRFGKPIGDIVIMASLLEKEARTTESRRIIAGILWKRIEIDMLLQVDAVFVYIIGKGTFQLSLDDLSIDSPYNTYKYKGLPIGPIANPGLDSLRAAVTPIESDYLFYLSDLEGKMHYSETFEEHKANKRRYF